MVTLVYIDDSQVSQLIIRKTKLAEGLIIDQPSLGLAAALAEGGDFVYVKVHQAPDHRIIP